MKIKNIVGRLLQQDHISPEEAIAILKSSTDDTHMVKQQIELEKAWKENKELKKEIALLSEQLKAEKIENDRSTWKKDFEDYIKKQQPIIQPVTMPYYPVKPYDPFDGRFDVTCRDTSSGIEPIASPTYERRLILDDKAKEMISKAVSVRPDDFTQSFLGVDKFEEKKKWHEENDSKVWDGMLEHQKKCGVDKIDDLKDLLPDTWKDDNISRPFFNSEDHYTIKISPEEIQKAWKENIIGVKPPADEHQITKADIGTKFGGGETQDFSVGRY